MTLPRQDPRFPDRPQTPDFWRLSEIVTHLDDTVKTSVDFNEFLKRWVDFDSLTYVANQRGLRGQSLGVSYASSFVDGFLTGVLFQQRGGHQE